MKLDGNIIGPCQLNTYGNSYSIIYNNTHNSVSGCVVLAGGVFFEWHSQSKKVVTLLVIEFKYSVVVGFCL